MNNLELVPILQTAIGPMILISGSGLVLLTMNTRLARTVDRARALAPRAAAEPRAREQLRILWRRAQILRWSIFFASLSALCAALLIILLFLTALLRVEIAVVTAGVFIAGMLFMIGALALFIHDVNYSLTALKIEIDRPA
jgi:hypothetical protein